MREKSMANKIVEKKEQIQTCLPSGAFLGLSVVSLGLSYVTKY